MNKTKTLFILIIFLGTALSCCKDDDDEKIEPKKFPHFSCIINGNQFFHANGNWLCPSQTFYYYPNGYLDAPPGLVSIDGGDCSNFDQIGIGLYNFQVTLDTIRMNSPANVDSCIAFFIGTTTDGNPIRFDEIMTGILKFDQFSDKNGDINGIVSGTFEFTVHNSEIDSTIAITDGKFQYIIDYEWY